MNKHRRWVRIIRRDLSTTIIELTISQVPTLGDGVLTNSEVLVLFSRYYMQRVAIEFEEDLDRVRNASDFDENALPQLVNALQQGVLVFSVEDQRRIGVERMRL
jgi:translation initiation factor 6 (eIF-6)